MFKNMSLAIMLAIAGCQPSYAAEAPESDPLMDNIQMLRIKFDHNSQYMGQGFYYIMTPSTLTVAWCITESNCYISPSTKMEKINNSSIVGLTN